MPSKKARNRAEEVIVDSHLQNAFALAVERILRHYAHNNDLIGNKILVHLFIEKRLPHVQSAGIMDAVTFFTDDDRHRINQLTLDIGGALATMLHAAKVSYQDIQQALNGEGLNDLKSLVCEHLLELQGGSPEPPVADWSLIPGYEAFTRKLHGTRSGW